MLESGFEHKPIIAFLLGTIAVSSIMIILHRSCYMTAFKRISSHKRLASLAVLNNGPPRPYSFQRMIELSFKFRYQVSTIFSREKPAPHPALLLTMRTNCDRICLLLIWRLTLPFFSMLA